MTRVRILSMPWSQGLAAVGIAPPPPAPPPATFDFYVSPTGGTGSGSIGDPWSLTHFMNHPGALQPGHTVGWRGGVYSGEFVCFVTGNAANPIALRAYTGERPRVDGNLVLTSSCNDVWIWGAEVFRSANPLTDNNVGIATHGPRCRVIHCIVHDASATGINADLPAPDVVLYGCLVYNNGTHPNLDHGTYFTNSTGTKLLKDNILFNNWAYNLHSYDSTVGNLLNISYIGNVAFGAASIQFPVNTASEIQLGGIPIIGAVVKENYTYNADRSRWAARFGYIGDLNSDLVLDDNVLVGYTTIDPFTTLSANRNVFYGSTNDTMLSTHGTTGGYTWGANTHYAGGNNWAHDGIDKNFAGWKTASGLGATDTNPGSALTGTQVYLRPSDYETKRANLIVYNWDGLSTVAVDLSSILTPGDAYQILNAQDFFGTPAVLGTYAGGSVNVPMAGIAAPVPTGRTYTTPPVTGPTFQVFVLRLQGA